MRFDEQQRKSFEEALQHISLAGMHPRDVQRLRAVGQTYFEALEMIWEGNVSLEQLRAHLGVTADEDAAEHPSS